MQPLAPLSWRELLRVNCSRLFGDLRHGFAQSSPLPTRAIVAGFTLIAALGFWLAGEEWPRLYVFESMRAVPRVVWAMSFTLGGIGQWWRLLDEKPRFCLGLLINAHVAACWSLLGICFAVSGAVAVAAGPLAVAAQAAWIAARTGVTQLDRSRA